MQVAPQCTVLSQMSTLEAPKSTFTESQAGINWVLPIFLVFCYSCARMLETKMDELQGR